MQTRLRCVLLFVTVTSGSAFGQVPSLPAFQQKIVAALNAAGKVPASVTMSGNASWTVGSDKDTGTLQIQIAADGTTKESWSFSKITHTYTQGPLNLLDLNRSCVSTDASGKLRQVTGPNCLEGLPWFFPAFVLEPVSQVALAVTDQTSKTDASQGLERLVYRL